MSTTSGSGPDVVLLHGVGLDGRMWDRCVPGLAASYRVTVVDLRGHGSSKPALAGTTLADLAGDVVDVLDSRKIDQAHLVGFSLGALVVQRMVIDHPQRVSSLALVSSVADRTDLERAAVLDRLEVSRISRYAVVEAAVDRWFGVEWAAEEPDLVSTVRATLLATDAASYLACYEIFARADAEVWPDLGEVSCPTLVVTGDLDPGSTPDMAARLGKAIPQADVQLVPDTRHLLPLERPTELTTALLHHFERTES